MRGNDPLRSAVNATLSDEQKEFLIERQKQMTADRKAKSEQKTADNKARAVEFAEKQKNSEAK